MDLIITLRKEVPDVATGEQLHAIVKQRLEDQPDIIVTGHLTHQIIALPEPE